jgi:hypothetical protein
MLQDSSDYDTTDERCGKIHCNLNPLIYCRYKYNIAKFINTMAV